MILANMSNCIVLFLAMGLSFLQHSDSCLNWSGQASIDLNSQMRFIQSTSKNQEIPKDFKNSKTLLELGVLDPAYEWWGLICLENSGVRPKSVALVLGNWTLHQATIHHVIDGQTVTVLETGFQVPPEDKALSLGYYQIVPLVLPANSQSRIFVNLKSHRKFPIITNPVLMSYDKMTMQVLQRQNLMSICYGILLLMLVYGSFLYVKMGAYVYLFYGLHLIAALVNLLAWNGVMSTYFCLHLLWQVPLWQIVIPGSWIFYFLFMVHMLESTSIANWFRTRKWYFIGLGAILYLLSIYLYVGQENLWLSSWLFIVQALLFAALVITICGLMLSKTRISRYFLYGSCLLALGILSNLVLSVFFESNSLSLVADPNLSIALALVLEMSFFTLGIAQKMKDQEIYGELQRRKISALLGKQKSYQSASQLTSIAEDISISSQELTPFVQKCVNIIKKNMDDSDFSVTLFAKEVLLSRVQLHRRLKAELCMSASEAVRWVRLTYAAQLLRSTDKNVTEVCYAVGFNNLSYFASCFKKQHGINPSEFRNRF